MSYLKNAWYVAAWADDLGDALISRTLLEKSVLLYRDSTGTPHAIGNVCPHRFAPLDMGRLVDDTIECGYHGLRFSGAGTCVFNPHDSTISSRARVPMYPLVERDTLLWIWLGDPALVDDKTVPNLSDRLSSNRFRAVHGSMKVAANYQLLADNLLDHSHGQFLHEKFLKFDGFFSVPLVSSQQGTTVIGDRHYRAVPGQPQFVKHLPQYSGTVDAWSVGQWMPPSICLQDIGVTNPGASDDDGIRRLGIHLLTPESESSTHYFYAAVRNHGLDDSDLDRDSYAWFQAALIEQDKPMLEAVQRMMGDRTLEELRPVLVSADGPAMRARKILRGLIQIEERTAPALALEAVKNGRS